VTKISEGRRRQILAEALTDARVRAETVGHPFAIESRGDFEAIFTVTQPPDHWLHKRLTIQSLGLWAPVWWYATRKGAAPKRYRLEVDDEGDLSISRRRRK